MSDQPKFPTEIVDLPSKGLLYPKDHPLSKGTIELKYMTAREEDILTSQNLIQKGVVIDEVLKSLIVNPKIKYGDLITGDKNAIMIAARILGYGKDYLADVTCGACGNVEKEVNFDLSTLDHKPIDDAEYNKDNVFDFELPTSKRTIQFKLLTQKDEEIITKELERISKVSKGKTAEVTTRLRHQLISVDGDDKKENITSFINNEFFAVDSRAFRTHYMSLMPDILYDVDYGCPACGHQDEIDLPISTNFFWPSR
tara:strand:+ start:353 stop:1117 length:765 start_codon:yes stop_codon:yes gene_type:complete